MKMLQVKHFLKVFFSSEILTGRFSKMNLIARARIPVIKFKETRTGISCDISVDNDGGVLKSRVLRWISSIDDRCRQLIFLVIMSHCI